MTAPRRLLVATDSTESTEANLQLLALVEWCKDLNVDVELVALRGGRARHRFGAAAPTLVVDDLRRTGPAGVPWRLGLDRLPRRIEAVRLRRWLASRRDRTFLIGHPRAVDLLRAAPRPKRLVVVAPGPGWTPGDLRPDEAEMLRPAAAWVVRTEAQRDEVRRVTDAAVITLDTSVGLPWRIPVRPRPGTGAVVLLGSEDPWGQPDLAVEVAWQLHRADPAVRLRWVVAGDREAWLARHDVEHACLTGAVDVVDQDDPDVLIDVAAVVGTGRFPTGSHLARAAALEGVTVLGWGLQHSLGGPSTAPADVERVVHDLLVTRTGRRRRHVDTPPPHRDLDRCDGDLIELLFPGAGETSSRR
jgi:hypothetical protein